MRILPVIDLLGGFVVHAVAGQRDQYQPIDSVLTPDATPRSIGLAFSQPFGATQAYVADLDAICGTPPAWNDYQQIANSKLHLWVDAGISSVRNATVFKERMNEDLTVVRMIVGLESLPNPRTLEQIVEHVGAERLVFSLDLRAGRLFTSSSAWQRLTPVEVVQAVVSTGVQRIIVLDLAQVGTGTGVGTGPLCRELRDTHPQLTLVAGGGVRNLDDLKDLKHAGCNAVLIGSAIHSGQITRAMLIDAGYLL